jgi:DNA-binding FrmR family transcriptional regulator
MVEQDKYCIDLLTQVSAVTKALRQCHWACWTTILRIVRRGHS